MGEGVIGDQVVRVVSESHAREQTTWFFRPTILLVTAYIIISVIHESAHALTAFALDIPFTLFPYGVNLARDRGTLMERAAIAVVGPLCALLAGLICWFFYRRARGSPSELMLLYLAMFGVGTFFGNLMSAASGGDLVGDFSRAALALRLPMSARYAVSLAGFLLLCGLNFMAGWELRRLSPAGSNKLRAMIVMVVLPAVTGTSIVTLASLPMPPALAFGRLAEALFWVCGAVGLLMSRRTPSGSSQTLQLSWADVAAFAVALIAVRFM